MGNRNCCIAEGPYTRACFMVSKYHPQQGFSGHITHLTLTSFSRSQQPLWNLTLPILKGGTFYHYGTYNLLIMHVGTYGQYLLRASKLGHCDFWPLTYRPKLTSPMLTQWGIEMAVFLSAFTNQPGLWCQSITHGKAFLDIPHIWPWPHFQCHNSHLIIEFVHYEVWRVCAVWYVPPIFRIFVSTWGLLFFFR